MDKKTPIYWRRKKKISNLSCSRLFFCSYKHVFCLYFRDFYLLLCWYLSTFFFKHKHKLCFTTWHIACVSLCLLVIFDLFSSSSLQVWSTSSFFVKILAVDPPKLKNSLTIVLWQTLPLLSQKLCNKVQVLAFFFDMKSPTSAGRRNPK